LNSESAAVICANCHKSVAPSAFNERSTVIIISNGCEVRTYKPSRTRDFIKNLSKGNGIQNWIPGGNEFFSIVDWK
jgi:hypothetical protein